MAFGVAAGISKTTSNSVQVAEKDDQNGTIDDMTSYGGKTTLTEESFTTSFTNTALNGQNGSSVITEHTLTESNKDYAKESKTTVTVLG